MFSRKDILFLVEEGGQLLQPIIKDLTPSRSTTRKEAKEYDTQKRKRLL